MTLNEPPPTPQLSELLSSEQSAQFSRLLLNLAARGFGRLEIVIERHRVRRMVPHRVIHRPGPQHFWPASTYDLGEWGSDLAAGLAEIMGSGWGVLTVDVEHGQIARVDVALSLPVEGSEGAWMQGGPLA